LADAAAAGGSGSRQPAATSKDALKKPSIILPARASPTTVRQALARVVVAALRVVLAALAVLVAVVRSPFSR
jgi:hypothetical protein